MVAETGVSSLSSSEEAVSVEADLRLAISDLDPDADVLAPLSRLLNLYITDEIAQRRPVLRAMRDFVMVALGNAADGDNLCTVASRALDAFIAVHVIGARAKASAFFDKLICETNWLRVAILAGSSVAEAAFLAVNNNNKSLTVIDVGPAFPGRALADKLARQTKAPVRYAPLASVHKALEQVDAVVMGAEEVMMNGCVVVSPGGGVVAQAAQEANLPILIVTQAVKFSNRALVEWFVKGDVLRPAEIQSIVTEMDADPTRPSFAPDIWKKLSGERLAN